MPAVRGDSDADADADGDNTMGDRSVDRIDESAGDSGPDASPRPDPASINGGAGAGAGSDAANGGSDASALPASAATDAGATSGAGQTANRPRHRLSVPQEIVLLRETLRRQPWAAEHGSVRQAWEDIAAATAQSPEFVSLGTTLKGTAALRRIQRVCDEIRFPNPNAQRLVGTRSEIEERKRLMLLVYERIVAHRTQKMVVASGLAQAITAGSAKKRRVVEEGMLSGAEISALTSPVDVQQQHPHHSLLPQVPLQLGPADLAAALQTSLMLYPSAPQLGQLLAATDAASFASLLASNKAALPQSLAGSVTPLGPKSAGADALAVGPSTVAGESSRRKRSFSLAEGSSPEVHSNKHDSDLDDDDDDDDDESDDDDDGAAAGHADAHLRSGSAGAQMAGAAAERKEAGASRASSTKRANRPTAAANEVAAMAAAAAAAAAATAASSATPAADPALHPTFSAAPGPSADVIGEALRTLSSRLGQPAGGISPSPVQPPNLVSLLPILQPQQMIQQLQTQQQLADPTFASRLQRIVEIQQQRLEIDQRRIALEERRLKIEERRMELELARRWADLHPSGVARRSARAAGTAAAADGDADGVAAADVSGSSTAPGGDEDILALLMHEVAELRGKLRDHERLLSPLRVPAASERPN
nr:hypothetical protein HK105_006732 [Polyrhizophydium stewartii]